MLTAVNAATEKAEATSRPSTCTLWQWAAFLVLIGVLLVADLLLVHRTRARDHLQGGGDRERRLDLASASRSPASSSGWHGGQAAGEYISGYLHREEPVGRQRVRLGGDLQLLRRARRSTSSATLFWGIFGALVLRAIFIFAGVALIETLRL